MANPKIVVPQFTGDDLMEVTDEMQPFFQRIFEYGYLKGYDDGDAAAVARILQAARPMANGHAAPTHSGQPARHGTNTYKLIHTVLQQAGSGGVTPIDIARSPLNKHKAGRSGIGKILRRGVKQGTFVAVGGGYYALKTGASK
jgi:hypothetical protein